MPPPASRKIEQKQYIVMFLGVGHYLSADSHSSCLGGWRLGWLVAGQTGRNLLSAAMTGMATFSIAVMLISRAAGSDAPFLVPHGLGSAGRVFFGPRDWRCTYFSNASSLMQGGG